MHKTFSAIMTLYQKLFKKFQEHSGYSYKKHQEEGMLWCVEKEQAKQPYQKIHGGFVADEMGCGKTFMMISLIVCKFVPRTLIVAPVALVQQWTDAIRTLVNYEPLVYYGHKMKSQQHRLHSASIIITTYGVLSKQYEKQGPLFRRNWDRVIYDEAHHMRNRKTVKYLAGFNLVSQVKWLVTGTPIQNKMRDLYTLCEILGIGNARNIIPEDLMRIILMRTKEEVGIKLPKLEEHIITIPWANSEEKALYTALDKLKNSGFTKVKQSVLSDACDSKGDVKCAFECIDDEPYVTDELQCNIAESKDVENKVADVVDIIYPEENITKKLIKFVRSIFGGLRLPYYLRARQMCVCPGLLRSLEKSMQHSEIYDQNGIKCALENHAKIDKVVDNLVKRAHNGNKKVVFCSFREEMDMIYNELNECGIEVLIYDGRTSRKDRVSIMRSLPAVLILQIQMGSEGLNLQMANEIHFVGPLWNPAMEQQAIARCYRTGQKKNTQIFKYVMTDIDSISSMDNYMTLTMSRKSHYAKTITAPEGRSRKLSYT